MHKGKIPIAIEKYVFRNGQPVREDDRRKFVAMTST